jgi:hypothetical protein
VANSESEGSIASCRQCEEDHTGLRAIRQGWPLVLTVRAAGDRNFERGLNAAAQSFIGQAKVLPPPDCRSGRFAASRLAGGRKSAPAAGLGARQLRQFLDLRRLDARARACSATDETFGR